MGCLVASQNTALSPQVSTNVRLLLLFFFVCSRPTCLPNRSHYYLIHNQPKSHLKTAFPVSFSISCIIFQLLL